MVVCPDKPVAIEPSVPSSRMPRRAKPDDDALVIGQRVRAFRQRAGLVRGYADQPQPIFVTPIGIDDVRDAHRMLDALDGDVLALFQ